MIRSGVITNRIFFSFMRAQHVLSYHLTYDQKKKCVFLREYQITVRTKLFSRRLNTHSTTDGLKSFVGPVFQIRVRGRLGANSKTYPVPIKISIFVMVQNQFRPSEMDGSGCFAPISVRIQTLFHYYFKKNYLMF